MVNPEWGMKRACPHCSKRYYDLARVPPTCPYCHHPFDPHLALRSRWSEPKLHEEKLDNNDFLNGDLDNEDLEPIEKEIDDAFDE